MAKLILSQVEQNPEEKNGTSVIAYFKGEPDEDDLEKAGADYEYGDPERRDNAVSTLAGLQRWVVCWSAND
jgi:hypothetical protein